MKEIHNLIDMPDKPLRKKNLKEMVRSEVEAMLNEGFVDEVELFLNMKYALEALTEGLKDENLRFAIAQKITDSNGEVSFRDVMMLTKKNGADKYDFSGDPVWRADNILLKDQQANAKVISDRMKEREQLLKSLLKNSAGQMVDDDGQVIPKPKLLSGGGEIITVNF